MTWFRTTWGGAGGASAGASATTTQLVWVLLLIQLMRIENSMLQTAILLSSTHRGGRV